MRKVFEEPVIKIMEFDTQDDICTASKENEGGNEDEDGNGDGDGRKTAL